MKRFSQRLAAVLLVLLAVTTTEAEDKKPADGKAAGDWIALFNGKDLDGWKVKITGHDLGDNFADTFRVEDGLLKVSYDGYSDFAGKFGHIFHEHEFSSYVMRVEYRFVGQQVPGGPGWAIRNSGVMVHGQKPETMDKDQKFPVSIEVQLLGGSGSGERTTANLCTPGTHVEMAGQLVTRHCTNSKSKTYHGDQWVTVEIEVRGARHYVYGATVWDTGGLAYLGEPLIASDTDLILGRLDGTLARFALDYMLANPPKTW